MKISVSLFIASKYHELKPLKIEHLRKISTFGSITEQNIVNYEGAFLIALNFNLHDPSPLDFIELLVARYNLSEYQR